MKGRHPVSVISLSSKMDFPVSDYIYHFFDAAEISSESLRRLRFNGKGLSVFFKKKTKEYLKECREAEKMFLQHDVNTGECNKASAEYFFYLIKCIEQSIGGGHVKINDPELRKLMRRERRINEKKK